MIPLFGDVALMECDETLWVMREGGPDGTDIPIVDGKPVKRSPWWYSIACNVQPVSGKELLLMPEGDRFRDQFNAYQQADPGESREVLRVNDKVCRAGKFWVVQQVTHWGSYVIGRFVRIDVGPDAQRVLSNPP